MKAEKMPDSSSDLVEVVVAVVTYRRNDELRRTLPRIWQQCAEVTGAARILVVDNDPEGGAAAVIAELQIALISYVREPAPGIAAARNTAMRQARPGELLIFIDDDETPKPLWLSSLVTTYLEYRSAAVSGMVTSEFDRPLEEWIDKGGFFERRRLATGTAIEAAATNNLLLDIDQIRSKELWFDERFGLTGGSDLLFTRQLTGSGGRMVWCAEAIVVDHVNAERATRHWVLRRALRYGNSGSRTSIALADAGLDRALARARMAAFGVARIAGGSLRLVIGLLTRSIGRQARGQRTVMKGVGYLIGAFGTAYVEYARTPPAEPANL